MFYLVDDERKFIVGWSAKCACSSIKWWYSQVMALGLSEDCIHEVRGDGQSIHEILGYGDTKWTRIEPGVTDKYQDYDKFVLIRNPYKRVVSGYIDKYILNDYNSTGWKNFQEFCHVLLADKNFELIDKHHFTPQTSEEFRKAAIYEWNWRLVLNVDSLEADIDKLNTILGTNVLLAQKNKIAYSQQRKLNKPAYEMSNSEIKEFMPGYRTFYNEEISRTIRNYYNLDFQYFETLGFKFDSPVLL